MKSKWKTIEEGLTRKKKKAVLKTFNPGVTQADIDELESLIGYALPENLKEFYRIHNGQDTGKVFNSAIIETETEGLMPFSKIMSEWQLFQQLNRDYPTAVSESDAATGIKPLYWNPLWIPLIGDGAGNVYCMDLDPAPEGSKGQIIFRDHAGPVYKLVAQSLEEWIDDYIGFDLS